jgi:glutamate-5-semialdehyde dehydrogenase
MKSEATIPIGASSGSLESAIAAQAQRAKEASAQLRTLSSRVKNQALDAMAHDLVARQDEIIAVNERDLAQGRERGLSEAMLDRLKLTPARIEVMAQGCREVMALPDPVGQVIKGWTQPNGLKIEQVRTPLGVVAIIYESRPNVTVDAAILCLKSGNATILRGGSEAFHSNQVLGAIISQAASGAGVPDGAIQMIATTDREATTILARQSGLVDLIVPRGGNALKKSLGAVATVPIIYAAGGVCHMFLDASAPIEEAAELVVNAKAQRPSTCNALETLLVHRGSAAQVLPRVCEKLREAKVELRGDEATRAIVEMGAASEDDWDAEYNDLTLAVKIVDGLDAAIAHIEKHGTGHSESIITRDFASAEEFLNRVDAAAVYANASTRFTDGFEFGLGAEIGISTQKLHARGPLGLEALTTNKYVVRGDNHIRS